MSRIAVIGAGYVGLTTAVCLAHVGHHVVCSDVSESRVAMLQRGEAPLTEQDLAEMLRSGIDGDRLLFTTDNKKAVEEAEFTFLCLPSPTTPSGGADTSYIEQAATEIGPHLRSESIVINKSTVPVGSTHLVARALGRSDVVAVSNPEFLREGSAVHDFLHPDRIVIGAEDESSAIKVSSLFLRDPRPAHRHRPGDGRDDQVRLERLPRHQDQLRQCRRRPVRGSRCRRPSGRARDGL